MVRPDRPSLGRQDSTGARSDTENVFGDRYAYNESPIEHTVSTSRPEMGRRRSIESDEEEDFDATNAHYADGSILSVDSSRSIRNSMRKSRGFMENPFGDENDDTIGEHGESTQSSSTRTPTEDASDRSMGRSNSLSSRTMTSATTASEYRSGPSHPYEQFTQNTPLARSPTALSSISRHPTGRQSLHGPAHPYNMYPQNVDEDNIDDTASSVGPNQGIAVGFPGGLLQPSRFRNDEDNRSEQLPPYSEYPEGGAPKHVVTTRPAVQEIRPSPTVEEPSPTSTAEEASPASYNPLITNREPQSMSDTASRVSSVPKPEAEEALVPDNEKDWSEKTWKEKRKTRFCGIPFGWLIVISGCFLFITLVCSATIGGFFGAQARAARGRENPNALFDAAPIHQNMTPLPVGHYQLQLGPPQEGQAECLTDDTQSASWDCSISNPGALAISISTSPNGQGQVANIFNINDPTMESTPVGYGTEIPQTVQVPLRIVKDMDAIPWGPAYQFQAVYTKIVVTLPGAFQPAQVNTPSSKRLAAEEFTPANPLMKRYWNSQASAGDQPWYCFWNNTLIEGFIYVRENSTSWYSNSTTKQRDYEHRNAYGHRREFGSSATTIPSATSTLSTSTSSLSSSSACSWSSGSILGTPTSTADPCPPVKGNDPWSALDLYPFIVKIEERRVPGDTARPYCQKMQVLDNGKAGLVIDPATQQPIVVQLSESSPGMDAYTSIYGNAGSSATTASKKRRGAGWIGARNADVEKKGKKGKRAMIEGACHCQWISGDLQGS